MCPVNLQQRGKNNSVKERVVSINARETGQSQANLTLSFTLDTTMNTDLNENTNHKTLRKKKQEKSLRST